MFVLWIAPDVLWPAYRSHWLLDNWLVGSARSSGPQEVKSDLVFLVFRIFGSVLLVPVLEELFWRGWLMRWLIRRTSSRPPANVHTLLVLGDSGPSSVSDVRAE